MSLTTGLPQPLPPVSMEVFENLQRILQLRQAELNGGFGFRQNPKPETEEMVSRLHFYQSG
jgi:hypothetical protein